MTIEEIMSLANARSGKQNYLAQNAPDLALFEAMVQAVSEAPGQAAATFETTVTVSGNNVGAFVAFWTAVSRKNFGGNYAVHLYAEVTATTITPPASATLTNFEVQWVNNGVTTNTAVNLSLDVAGSTSSTVSDTLIDNGTTVDWKYDLGGYSAGSCTLKMKATILRLA